MVVMRRMRWIRSVKMSEGMLARSIDAESPMNFDED